MTLFQITRHQCWKPTREPRRSQESDKKESDMRFHSLTKCIWAMPSALRKQQTYFSAWPQRPQDLQQSRARKSPRQRHAFSQRLKTHLAMHSAPRQQTCSSFKAPRSVGAKWPPCVFHSLQHAFKPCPPSPGHKKPQDSHMRFPRLPKRI